MDEKSEKPEGDSADAEKAGGQKKPTRRTLDKPAEDGLPAIIDVTGKSGRSLFIGIGGGDVPPSRRK